jgi:dihydrolipoamide dehydrogenase
MTTHVAIVGAYGSAGAAATRKLVDAPDVELTLIDDGQPGGGLCILRGCMPSKEVLSAAGHRYQARSDHRLDGDPPDLDLGEVVATKNGHTRSWAAHRRGAIETFAEEDDVELLRDTARFDDDRTLDVAGRTLEPDYVLVATGSTVNAPEIDGIDEVDPWTSADVLDATSLPDSAVVMGFGYVGLELVPYLAEAGVDLTVIEHDARPLDEADDAFGDELLDLYRDEFGVEILTHTSEQSVEPTDDGGVRLHVEREDEHGHEFGDAVEADDLFLFTGRRPNLDGLGLDAAGIEPEPGWVHDTMQARDHDRVFVAGDANGKEPILHVAKEQAQTAAANVLRHARGDDLREYRNVHHHVVFSGAAVYPYVRVGHSEASADDADHDYLAVTREASEDGVFKTKNAPEGLATLVVDREDGTVLGYQGLHYHADVMAKTMQVVVETGMDVREVPDRAYHPTTPEILDGLFRAAKQRLAD